MASVKTITFNATAAWVMPFWNQAVTIQISSVDSTLAAGISLVTLTRVDTNQVVGAFQVLPNPVSSPGAGGFANTVTLLNLTANGSPVTTNGYISGSPNENYPAATMPAGAYTVTVMPTGPVPGTVWTFLTGPVAPGPFFGPVAPPGGTFLIETNEPFPGPFDPSIMPYKILLSSGATDLGEFLVTSVGYGNFTGTTGKLAGGFWVQTLSTTQAGFQIPLLSSLKVTVEVNTIWPTGPVYCQNITQSWGPGLAIGSIFSIQAGSPFPDPSLSSAVYPFQAVVSYPTSTTINSNRVIPANMPVAVLSITGTHVSGAASYLDCVLVAADPYYLQSSGLGGGYLDMFVSPISLNVPGQPPPTVPVPTPPPITPTPPPSNPVTNPTAPALVSELPAGGPMVYYQGRLWYANGRTFTAGDIVGSLASGTAAYNYTDSVLKVTENPLAIGGDGFSVPNNAGDITALAYTANLDVSFGQGPLYIGTRRQWYAMTVPVTRAAWIAADASQRPVLTVAQIKYGPVNDLSVVHVNGDLFHQSLEPAIRSLFISTRYFQQWANTPISRNENRVLEFNDRSLMWAAPGIQFDNRLLMGVLPYATPVGPAFKGVIPFDFDIISTIADKDQPPPPAWEGLWQGLNFLGLVEGDFGGLQRAFAPVWSDANQCIQIWELTNYLTYDLLADGTQNRITWFVETPAYDWQKLFELKKLDGGELYIDSVYGTVNLKVEYRVDADNCWQFWTQTQFCSAKDDCEAGTDPTCNYPVATLCQGQKFPLGLSAPQVPAAPITMNQRPANIGFQFQVRITVTGYCRIRGLMLFATQVDRQPFFNIQPPPP